MRIGPMKLKAGDVVRGRGMSVEVVAGEPVETDRGVVVPVEGGGELVFARLQFAVMANVPERFRP